MPGGGLFDIILNVIMKKFLLFAGLIGVGIGVANAAVRDATSVKRQTGTSQSGQNITARTTASTTTPRTGIVTTRNATLSRGATARTATTSSRSARTTVQSSNTATRSAVSTPNTARTARAATALTPVGAISRAARTPARAATTSNTFGTGYNACRDAYFTCMDQFCANQNDTYRRCVCSSRLADIKSRERTLVQTSDQLQDFTNLNIEVIPKTAAEVNAMLNATAGESKASATKDTSASAQQLAGISEVLSNTKSKALSTQGTLDIAGDINAIWATTDLASGAQIANLTGEPLYNAVHAQCAELVANQCSTRSTLNMVVSAYGMYIENDCNALATALDKKFTAANAAIRTTENAMQTARLENYDAHNSTTINDCIAQVRKDITSETACGKDYVHCLDVSGKYLNRDTGEPIYSPDFYQLESSISLAGDVLNNQANRMIVNELNRKRSYAARGLDTCRDLADDVWDEFMRQAITEIYQGQHERIRQVKNECLDVVNQCYDTQNQSLKDFSNVKEQLLLGSRMELSEEMCKDKLYACANLYGGGANGLDELVNAMGAITDQNIAKECQATLLAYAKEMCAAPSNDSLHSYPFGCRTYNPGTQQYAAMCPVNNSWNSDDNKKSGEEVATVVQTYSPLAPVFTASTGGYSCPLLKKYTKCNPGYYMTDSPTSSKYNGTPKAGNSCRPCAALKGNCTCPGGTANAVCDGSISEDARCATYYNGTLYQKMVSYAMQTCVRPSKSNEMPPSNILQDVNVVMDSIRVDMAKQLARECERLGGIWIDTERDDSDDVTTASQPATPSRSGETGADAIFDKRTHEMHKTFYIETSASTKWGYCAAPVDTAPDMQTGCTQTGGEWSSTTSTCTCALSKIWNATTARCVYANEKTACEETSNLTETETNKKWNPLTETCNCGSKKYNQTTYECE